MGSEKAKERRATIDEIKENYSELTDDEEGAGEEYERVFEVRGSERIQVLALLGETFERKWWDSLVLHAIMIHLQEEEGWGDMSLHTLSEYEQAILELPEEDLNTAIDEEVRAKLEDGTQLVPEGEAVVYAERCKNVSSKEGVIKVLRETFERIEKEHPFNRDRIRQFAIMTEAELKQGGDPELN